MAKPGLITTVRVTATFTLIPAEPLLDYGSKRPPLFGTVTKEKIKEKPKKSNPPPETPYSSPAEATKEGLGRNARTT